MPRIPPPTWVACVALIACALCDPLPTLPAAGALRKAKDRKPAPAFELVDSAGRTVRRADYQGKVLLLSFWATWCAPCRTEIPWFVELGRKYREQGLAVLGLAMDDEGWSVVRPFMDKVGIDYPVALATRRVAYLYGDIDRLPVTFLLDRDQKVAAIYAGLLEKDDLERDIRQLLAAAPR